MPKHDDTIDERKAAGQTTEDAPSEDAKAEEGAPDEKGGNRIAGFGRKAASAAKGGANVASKSIFDGYSAMREVHNASKQHSSARAHLEEIQTEIDESTRELDHRTDYYTRYDEIVAEQTDELADANKEHEDVQATIDELNREHEELSDKLTEMKKQHEQELRPFKELMDSSRERADDAARSLTEAKRSVKIAENQVNDLTARRDSRLANANRTIDNARSRLAELQTNLEKLRADPATKPEAIEEVNADILTEQNHLKSAQKEVDDVTAEMQRATENAQSHLWTQKQSLESAERANNTAKADASRRHDDYEKKRQDAETQEAVLDNAVVEREMKIRDAKKDLEAAKKRIDAAQDVLDEAEDIHAHPEEIERLKALIADDKAALEVQQQQVDGLAKAERSLRDRTRTQRSVFIGVIIAAAVIIILVVWLLFF
jgi:predicted  nucleic acid-binding Zn-ribbon protein